MKLLEECITFFSKKVESDKQSEYFEYYKSALYHLNDYRDLLQIACCNSVDFDSFKNKEKFDERDKNLC